MRVCVTGGAGYVGSVLVPKLLAAGHHVRVLDLCWFGNYLEPHPRLKVIQADIRNLDLQIGAADALIHLAAVANDPAGDLDPKLTWEVNALATMQLADRCAHEGVSQFIYASSGSVYGVSDAPQVTETTPLVPLSDYNKTKMVAERCVLSYGRKMQVQVIRPGTVCGYSPRMRLDVVVNMLTMQALTKSVITVLGGQQMRPHICIEDMTDLYLFMLGHSEMTGIYNAGFENISVAAIARMAANIIGSRIVTLPSTDPRDYRMNSDKLLKAGFKPTQTVFKAILQITEKFNNGQFKDEPQWHNLKMMPKAA